MKTAKSDRAKRLDKSLFEAGQQCRKRLHLDFQKPATESSDEQRRARSAAGQQLLQLARNAFPRGVEVGGSSLSEAAARTRELLAMDASAAIFGATFQTDELEMQTDIVLRQVDGELILYEVKTGTKVRSRYISDLALQVLAIEANGYKVRATHILHIQHNYAHTEGQELLPQQLFKNVDVTERVRRILPHVTEQLRSFHKQLHDASVLDLPTGTYCNNPFPCPRISACAQQGPKFSLQKLPELTPTLEAAFHEEGLIDLATIDPLRAGLTARQKLALRCVREGALIVEPFVREELRNIKYPLHYLVLANATETLPRFSGQRPWRQLPYAWALASTHENGQVTSVSFAFADKADPRNEFLTSLTAQLVGGGTILCWSTEALVSLRALIDDLPMEKARVRALLKRSRIDMMKLFESGVFHPELLGHHDFATTLQVLLAKQLPQALAIRSEADAFAAMQKSWQPRIRDATKEKLAADLKAWVEWQADGLRELHQKFSELLPKSPDPLLAPPAKSRKRLPPVA